MIRKRFALMTALLVAGALPSFAPAQEADDVNVVEEGGKKVKYKARTEISFEGVDVEGEIKKPAGAYLQDRKRARFSPLIKFRVDFDKEMLQSANDVK
jgi:hypothetical protein